MGTTKRWLLETHLSPGTHVNVQLSLQWAVCIQALTTGMLL